MSTHAIIALQEKLQEAQEAHADQVELDHEAIEEGKRAEQRVAAAARVMTDIEEAIRVLARAESAKQHALEEE